MQGVCMICNRELKNDEQDYTCDAKIAVCRAIKIWGHRVCLENVMDLVVAPNRYQFNRLMRVCHREGP